MTKPHPHRALSPEETGQALRVPIYKGCWHLADEHIKIYTRAKPSLWRRFWVSLFFDIEWYEC